MRNNFVKYFGKLIVPYSWRLVDTALGIFMFFFIVLPVFVFWCIGKTICVELLNGDAYSILRYILFVLYVVYIVGLLRAFCVCGAVNNLRRIQELKGKLEKSENVDEKSRKEMQKEIMKLTRQYNRILGEN